MNCLKIHLPTRSHGRGKAFAWALCTAVVAAASACPNVSQGETAVQGFAPNPNGPVVSLVAQPDGKLIVGGTFTTIHGQPRSRIARLNADGSLDTTFTAPP